VVFLFIALFAEVVVSASAIFVVAVPPVIHGGNRAFTVVACIVELRLGRVKLEKHDQ